MPHPPLDYTTPPYLPYLHSPSPRNQDVRVDGPKEWVNGGRINK